VLRRFVTQMPVRFDVAAGPVVVHGAMIDVDEGTGRATAIRRLREQVDT
jgi:calcineurin-like phosphoesterase